MVDVAQLNLAAMLEAQIAVLNIAIEILNNDGRITRMQIASPMDVEPAQEISVETSFMEHPPEMIEAIVVQMQQQIDKLNSQLAELGVSGTPAPPRAASRKR